MVLAGLKVFALDAAMPFDFEARANAKLKQQTALRIGIVGFGTFGQFLAKRLVQQGHKVHLHAFQQRKYNKIPLPYGIVEAGSTATTCPVCNVAGHMAPRKGFPF